MNKYYRPSGKASPFSLFYFFVSEFFILPTLAWLYVNATSLSPFIPLNFLITLAFGALIGLTLHYFIIGVGKVRNKNLAVLFGLSSGLIAWYIQWAMWIGVKSNPEMLGGVDQFFSININPLDVMVRTLDISKTRSIPFLGVYFHGVVVSLIWLAEAAMVIGISIAIALRKSKEPFSESQNTWATKTILPPYEYIEIGWWLRSTLEDDDSSFLKTLKKAATDKKSHSIFTLYDCGENKYYLSINNKMAIPDANGKLKFENDKFIEQIFIDKSSAEFLLSFETNHFHASPRQPSAWNMETIKL